jgi:hypothetical protein
MAKRINIVGAKPKRIGIVNRPKPRLDPAEIAEGLGAVPCGERVAGNLDLIDLAELGTQLLARLRSSGGRPALTDATEICRVPLGVEDFKALEKLTEQIAQTTGTKPSPGQVASVIVRNYLAEASAKAPASSLTPNLIPKELLDAWMSRMAQVAREASSLQRCANGLEATATEIKEDIAKCLQGINK